MLFSKHNLHDWQLNLFKSVFIHFTTQVASPEIEPIQLSTVIGSIQLTTQVKLLLKILIQINSWLKHKAIRLEAIHESGSHASLVPTQDSKD